MQIVDRGANVSNIYWQPIIFHWVFSLCQKSRTASSFQPATKCYQYGVFHAIFVSYMYSNQLTARHVQMFSYGYDYCIEIQILLTLGSLLVLFQVPGIVTHAKQAYTTES